jgi:hypothetical protein
MTGRRPRVRPEDLFTALALIAVIVAITAAVLVSL